MPHEQPEESPTAEPAAFQAELARLKGEMQAVRAALVAASIGDDPIAAALAEARLRLAGAWRLRLQARIALAESRAVRAYIESATRRDN